jgi:hypothetical protein
MQLDLSVLDEKEKLTLLSMQRYLPKNEIRHGNAMIRKLLVEAWAEGNIDGVLEMLGNDYTIKFIFDNIKPLKAAGLYEKGLLCAYSGVRINSHACPLCTLSQLFSLGDADKFRDAGDQIPSQGEFKLYRGVSGTGRARRVSGMSWTDDPHVAAWFAVRLIDSGLEDPAVFTITVQHSHVLAYLNGKSEKEYLLRLPLPCKPKRLKVMPDVRKPSR